LIEITNAANPLTKDFEFEGRMNGNVDYDLEGNVSFEVLNLYGTPRDIFVRKYTIEDNVDFGDPRRSKIPTFPSIDPPAMICRRRAAGDASGRRAPQVPVRGRRQPVRLSQRLSGGDDSRNHRGGAPRPSPIRSAHITDGSVTFTTRNAWARSFQVAS
jgi:hypothetical protein